ncbi:hypothetical protein HanRHA438_Chr13g0627861 [Helianthus annuus]|nr:hypothetical protein HanRHA438_Chr13g0627861 [Helianthus annuus]
MKIGLLITFHCFLHYFRVKTTIKTKQANQSPFLLCEIYEIVEQDNYHFALFYEDSFGESINEILSLCFRVHLRGF